MINRDFRAGEEKIEMEDWIKNYVVGKTGGTCN